jgi:transcriptional regulator with XRE-family HTH domain
VSDRVSIAEAIILLRKRLGLKQKALAKRAGVSMAHMSRIENKKVEVKSSTLKRIAEGLEVGLPGLLSAAEELRRSRAREIPVEVEYPSTEPTRSQDEVREEMARVQYFLDLDDESDPPS